MRYFIFLALLLTSNSLLAAEFNHTVWDDLLSKHVRVIDGGKSTQVDYAGFKADHELLAFYLDSLSMVEKNTFSQWPKPEQLAFLINAYNAWTVQLILTAYPDLNSIKDLGGFLQSPWEKAFIPLLGKTVTLDHIEHELIRGSGDFNEPRVHFAVNCASVGCPALRNEAYVAERLEQQLEAQTALFLADRSRNYLDNDKLYVSPIFKWYREDFDRPWRSSNSLASFLALFSDALELDNARQAALLAGKIKIRFTDYDWTLNDTS